MFISSLGIDKSPDDPKDEVTKLINKQPLLNRTVIKLGKAMPFKLTPFMPLRFFGRILSPLFVKMFMKKKMPGIPQEDFDDMYRYMYQILLRSGSGEHALNILFVEGIVPYTPLVDSLEFFDKHNIKYSFIYGDKDWMNTDFNGKLSYS